MNDAELFVLTDEDGNEHEFIELFSFDSEDFGKSYIILGPADAAMDGDDEEEVGIMPFISIRMMKKVCCNQSKLTQNLIWLKK